MTAPPLAPRAASSSAPTSPQVPAPAATNLPRTAAGLRTAWDPRLVGRMNDCDIKLAFLDGVYVWHSHPDTDEAFYVLDGEVVIDVRDQDGPVPDTDNGTDAQDAGWRSVTLHTGDIYIVPRGVQHRPHSTGARVMLLERAGTLSTGDFGGVVPEHIHSHRGR